MRSSWLLGLTISTLWCSAPFISSAHADDDKAAAEALFDEARRLMADKRFAEACPKLESSQRLDPGVGTMLNLADCYEKSGKTASAWAQFRETASAARKAGSREREEIARQRASELEPKLSYLTIVTWQGQEVHVQRDGTTVDAAVLGTRIPVDPGAHEITASAEGKRTWSTTVEVAAEPGSTKVTVPILPDESSGEGPPVDGVELERRAGAPSDGDDGSTQRILAGVVGGVGLVGVVVGSVFGLKASSDWDEAKSDCNPYPKCGPDGKKLGDDAQSAATISTIAFVVGGAGIAGGLILWLTAPDGDGTETAVGVGPGRVLVHGRF